MSNHRNLYFISSQAMIQQVARGSHESSPDDLITVHNAPGNSSAKFYDDQPWLTLNSGYTYAEVNAHILAEWQRILSPWAIGITKVPMSEILLNTDLRT